MNGQSFSPKSSQARKKPPVPPLSKAPTDIVMYHFPVFVWLDAIADLSVISKYLNEALYNDWHIINEINK